VVIFAGFIMVPSRVVKDEGIHAGKTVYGTVKG
jgi:hypothetical protein